MSLGKVPTRSPTHREVEPARLAALGLEVEELADGQPVSLEALLELARDRGRPVSHYFAGATLGADVEVAVSHPVQVVACVGKCQQWGALDVIDRVADEWEKSPRFDLSTRQCLDRCDQAAVCEIRGPDGNIVLTRATPDTVVAALAEVLAAG